MRDHLAAPTRARARIRTYTLRLAGIVALVTTLGALVAVPVASAHHRLTNAKRRVAKDNARRRSLRVHRLGTAATGGCHGAYLRITAATRAELQRSVVCLVNRQRRVHGLPPLVANLRLDDSAQRWTNEMVQHHDFSHGSDFSGRITSVGFNWSRAGENIAAGYRTPASVVRGWMASTGHCQNILNPMFREVGTGLNNGSVTSGGSERGVWTQDFGLLMGQRPRSGNWRPAYGCPYG